MVTMTLREAAKFLDVDATTLLAWQQLFGFPRRLAVENGRSAYLHEELLALREALQTSWSVVSAVGRAAGRAGADTESDVRQVRLVANG